MSVRPPTLPPLNYPFSTRIEEDNRIGRVFAILPKDCNPPEMNDDEDALFKELTYTGFITVYENLPVHYQLVGSGKPELAINWQLQSDMRRDLPVYIRLCDLFDDEARHLIVLPIWRSFTRSLETVLSIENIRYLVAYPWQDPQNFGTNNTLAPYHYVCVYV
jgi:hypothetical protein